MALLGQCVGENQRGPSMIAIRYFQCVTILMGVDGSVIVQWTVGSPSLEQDWSPVQHWKHDHDRQYPNYAADQPQRRSFEDGHGLAKESGL